MSSSVYRHPFSFISSWYDFQSISTVSYLYPLSLVSLVPSFPSTLAKYFWISFTLFSILLMGLWGLYMNMLGICFPSLPTRLWAWPTSAVPIPPSIARQHMKIVPRTVPSTTLSYSGTSEKPWALTRLVCGEPKDRSSNSSCVQHTRRHHMDGCMHAHTMNANTNNCLKEDKVFLPLNWNPRLQSQLPLTHSSNPPLLQLPFVSAQNLSCL